MLARILERLMRPFGIELATLGTWERDQRYLSILDHILTIIGDDPENATLEGARAELAEIRDVIHQELTGEPSRIWGEPDDRD